MTRRYKTPKPFDNDPDELWLLQEELAEFGETDLDEEEAYREIAASILDGKPLRALGFDEEEDYGEFDV